MIHTADNEMAVGNATQNAERRMENQGERCRRGSLLNRAAFKRRALDLAAMMRPAWKPERVSEAFLNRAEAQLIAWLRMEVHRAPSKGKTL